MAKKVVATLKNKDASKGYAKVIKAIKSESGAYTFREEIIPVDQVQDALKR